MLCFIDRSISLPLLLLQVQMKMTACEEGKHIKIVSSLCNKNVHGMFLGPRRKTRWRIWVDGDSQDSRNLWTSSIAHVDDDDASDRREDMRLSRDEHDGLSRETSALAEGRKALKIKLKKMKTKQHQLTSTTTCCFLNLPLRLCLSGKDLHVEIVRQDSQHCASLGHMRLLVLCRMCFCTKNTPLEQH